MSEKQVYALRLELVMHSWRGIYNEADGVIVATVVDGSNDEPRGLSFDPRDGLTIEGHISQRVEHNGRPDHDASVWWYETGFRHGTLMNLRDLRRMQSALTTFDRRFGDTQTKLGAPANFEQYLSYAAAALGITRFYTWHEQWREWRVIDRAAARHWVLHTVRDFEEKHPTIQIAAS